MPNAIFDAMYAKYDSDRIYQAWISGQRKPSLKTVVAHTIAALSSTPSAYLALAQAENTFEMACIVPVFIGSTLARALAFDNLLSMGINYFKKDSAQIERLNLISILENLRRGVELLPPGILLALSDSLLEDEGQELRPITSLSRSHSEPIFSMRATFFAREIKSAPASACGANAVTPRLLG